MKRLIIKTFIIIIIPVIISSIIMLAKKDNRSKYSHEVNALLAYERLDSLKDTNKIVIISGSNGSFSINSKILEDSLRMPVVNTSTHAGIGIRMQFEIYKDFLKKGDIVIFCPEYCNDWSRLYGSSTLISILSTHLPQAYSKMNLRQWYHNFNTIGIHYAGARRHEKVQPYGGPYSASAVNSYGDISYPREHQEIEHMYTVRGEMDKELTSYYQYIHKFLKDKEITLVYLPPTFMKSNYMERKSQIDSLEIFMKDHDIPFQAKPERYVFDDTLYFDTSYHMTNYGADLRTLKMVEDVRRVLN